jgi:carboxymethylenebutenolidase
MPMSSAKPKEPSSVGALFDQHIGREFADRDVDATMNTMIVEPHVHCVPIMTGGSGSHR